jgi:hypothetical protein
MVYRLNSTACCVCFRWNMKRASATIFMSTQPCSIIAQVLKEQVTSACPVRSWYRDRQTFWRKSLPKYNEEWTEKLQTLLNSREFQTKIFQKSFKCIIDFAKCRRYVVICAKTPPSINVMSQEFSRRSIQYMSARGLVHLQRRRTSVKTGPIQTMKGDIAWRYVDTVAIQ